MKCPVCSEPSTRVLDSRVAKKAEQIRRRRECPSCSERFTTYERIESGLPMVVKKDGEKVLFDRAKIRAGIVVATWKRGIGEREIDDFIDVIESRYRTRNQRELPSSQIGDEVLKFLLQRDQVAYIRFASVYGEFATVSEFKALLRDLENNHDR
jgi:transcriptional repressor NrdR